MRIDSLPAIIKQFEYYKLLGERTFEQITDDDLFWEFNEESNSIAIIVNHLSGNMKSRWTDFLKSDGEKTWRNREQEFESIIKTREHLIEAWNEGWHCLFSALNSINESNINSNITIRNQKLSIEEAIHRQMMHYAYHIGQIVYLGRMKAGDKWKSLSIPKGGSDKFNQEKKEKGIHGGHFTDDFR